VEEQAKDAVNYKQHHIALERKMRKKRNDALAALMEQQKIAEALRTELEAEQSGRPHLRDTEGMKSNCITIVVPVEYKVRRTHCTRTMMWLRSSPNYYMDIVKGWYETWMTKLKEESYGEDRDYTEGVEEDDVNNEYEDKIYGDMVEGGDMVTGAEHDGWRRSKD
jgi:hypothetical protein